MKSEREDRFRWPNTSNLNYFPEESYIVHVFYTAIIRPTLTYMNARYTAINKEIIEKNWYRSKITYC